MFFAHLGRVGALDWPKLLRAGPPNLITIAGDLGLAGFDAELGDSRFGK
jgi:hypothetical protein